MDDRAKRLSAEERRIRRNTELMTRCKWLFDPHELFGVRKKYKLISFTDGSWKPIS